MLPSISFAPPAPEKPFVQYVANFWLPDSPYVKECALVKKKPLSAAYVNMNHENVRRHMASFPGFQSITLRGLTAGIIRDWITWAADNGLSGRIINLVLQGMRIPVRYAVMREEISQDPFRNIKNAPETHREKGILTQAEVSRLIAVLERDPRTRLAVLLGLLCGMRRGEVRGLLWGDIGEGLINIRHNFQEGEGLKAPKYGSSRTVPIPGSVQSVLETVRAISGNPGPDMYVFNNPANHKPLSPKYFQRALQVELQAIGIPGKWHPPLHPGKKPSAEEKKPPEGYVNEQLRRNLTFHGLRHTFITLGRLAGITDLEIQALAGHRSGEMMERYSHAAQVLDFTAARKKLEKVIGEA
jgi:integrase